LQTRHLKGRAYTGKKKINHVTLVLDSKINEVEKTIQMNRWDKKVNPIGNRLGIIKGWDSNW